MGLKAKLQTALEDYVGKVILPLTYKVQLSQRIEDYEMYLNVVLDELRKVKEGDGNA